MKSRIFRVFMGYIFPIFIIGCVLGMFFIRFQYIGDYIKSFFFMAHFLGAFSILFFSIPIIIYSCLMEFVINPKLANSYWAVFINTILVVIIIFSVYVFIAYKANSFGQDLFQGGGQYILLLIGLGIGLLSGAWLRFIYIRQNNGQTLPVSALCINTLIIFSFILSFIIFIALFGAWLLK